MFRLSKLRKYNDDMYAEARGAYAGFITAKEAYDKCRHELRHCKASDIEQAGNRAKEAQIEFEQEAVKLFTILMAYPDRLNAIEKLMSEIATTASKTVKKVRKSKDLPPPTIWGLCMHDDYFSFTNVTYNPCFLCSETRVVDFDDTRFVDLDDISAYEWTCTE